MYDCFDRRIRLGLEMQKFKEDSDCIWLLC